MCGADKAKTKKIQGEANPLWVQDFKFSIERKENTRSKNWVEGIVIDLKAVGVITGMRTAFFFET